MLLGTFHGCSPMGGGRRRTGSISPTGAGSSTSTHRRRGGRAPPEILTPGCPTAIPSSLPRWAGRKTRSRNRNRRRRFRTRTRTRTNDVPTQPLPHCWRLTISTHPAAPRHSQTPLPPPPPPPPAAAPSKPASSAAPKLPARPTFATPTWYRSNGAAIPSAVPSS